MTTATPSISDISQICIQRTRRQLLIPPPPRLNIVSPYPQYTQYELNMRRKAEILKYDTSNSKTKNLTKAERFAQLTQGSTQRRSYTNQQLQDISIGKNQCPDDRTLPTLTTSCNVPGPIQVLQLNPQIPLYNYEGVLTNAFSENNVNREQSLFLFFPSTNPVTTTLNKMSDIVGTLFINNTLFNNTYYFNLTTQITSDTLKVVHVYVYYNTILISTSDDQTLLTSPSLYPIPIVTIRNQEINTKLRLYGQPGFIYDIKFKPVLYNNDETVTETTFFGFTAL